MQGFYSFTTKIYPILTTSRLPPKTWVRFYNVIIQYYVRRYGSLARRTDREPDTFRDFIGERAPAGSFTTIHTHIHILYTLPNGSYYKYSSKYIPRQPCETTTWAGKRGQPLHAPLLQRRWIQILNGFLSRRFLPQNL